MTLELVVDTDMGVDDAAALGWLSEQNVRELRIAGVCSVWGNTSAERAAQNAAAVLAALGRSEVPVAIGAAGPMQGKPSRVGMLAHGRDGMWGACPPAPDPVRLQGDAVALYRELGERHPGATILAIGPLTNLAAVLEADSEGLAAFGRIVILGGAHHRGTMTPVSETNFWHDPEAVERVLSARLPVTLVTRDAHRAFSLDAEQLKQATAGRSRLARTLAPALEAYGNAQRRFGEAVNLGDVVAAALAVEPSWATISQRALVRVIGSGGDPLVRGQSIIGATPNEKLTMVDGGVAVRDLIERVAEDPAIDVRAQVGAVLARAKDNADVVLGVDVEAIKTAFLEVLA